MRSNKLIALMIAPIFAVGMAACGTDETMDDDIWTEEGQLPAYEAEPEPFQDPEFEMERDTLMVPEGHPEGDPDMRPETDPETQPQY